MRKSFFYRVINYAEKFENASRPVSRVLFFRQPSILVRCCQTASCDFFRDGTSSPMVSVCLASGGVYRVPRRLPPQRWALTPPFHLTKRIRRSISVALSLESPPPAVSRHPALRSPDFPYSYERDCPTYSHNPNHYK